MSFIGELFLIDLTKPLRMPQRDVCMTNLAMDISKVVPKGSHFANWETHDGLDWQHFEWKERWSVRPVQYYIIDFGISLPLPEKNLVTFGVWGRDRTVPEMSPTNQYNPFKVDVYQLGRVFLQMIDVCLFHLSAHTSANRHRNTTDCPCFCPWQSG
jgi:serine/threonine protein kinase